MRKKCKECNGSGEILIFYNDNKPHKLKKGDGLQPCPTCNGTGIEQKGGDKR
ncbi:MAG: hypothetical protein PHF74_05655 [Dehalococcoidales bacterium]|nr:hypothetical protein [Dehalococcoidales bacterium]